MIISKYFWHLWRFLNKFSFLKPKIDLSGDRDIEWSWVASKIGFGRGEALDFGPGGSFLGLIAAQSGYNVTAIDIQNINWKYKHPKLFFLQGDIAKVTLKSNFYDLIINCSSIEHVGLVGRYGISEYVENADIVIMKKLRGSLKTGGEMLLTIPIGIDTTFYPLHRVYGKERLPKLIEDFRIIKSEFWIKNSSNCWIIADRDEALNSIPGKNYYAIGCFLLIKEEIKL
jgi:SAM-dependent methyltransferase